MKNVLLIGLFVFITGCASIYQGTDSSDVAFVSVPETKASYQFLGGASGQNVAVGDINEKGCMVNVQQVNDTSLNEGGMLVVPAEREIGLSVSAYQGNSSCGLGIAVMLESNKKYVLSFGESYTACGIGLVTESEDGKLEKVEFERLFPGFSKMCKK